MNITCRLCNRKWNCLKDKTCSVRQSNIALCEMCIHCFAKAEEISIEKAKDTNQSCYSKVEFNPSCRSWK